MMTQKRYRKNHGIIVLCIDLVHAPIELAIVDRLTDIMCTVQYNQKKEKKDVRNLLRQNNEFCKSAAFDCEVADYERL